MDEKLIREQMVMVCQRMWQQGWVAANDGNVSVKIDENTYLTTPTGVSKSFVTADSLVLVDGTGAVLKAAEGCRPSSEFPMHLRCYKERPDIGAVVHAHPPTATGFAIAHVPLDKYTMPEAILNLGPVPLAVYGTPSTEEIPDSIAPFLPDHNAFLLANHGALTIGKDLISAYYRMETLEHFAKTTLTATLLGGAVELSDKQVENCLALRTKFNMTDPHPGCKKHCK